MQLRAYVARFGDQVEQEIRDRAKKDPYATELVKHKVMPMDKRYLKYALKPIDPRMPWVSIWYSDTRRKILDVGGYWEFPYIVSRYAKNSGEAYGRSPGQDALGDIMGACQMSKSRIKLGQTIADPTLLVDEKLEGRDDVLPGGRIYINKSTMKPEALNIGANYPITIDNEKRQDEIIDDHFNVGIYLMLQQAEAQMTAREVMERMGEKAAVLGYITGRFQDEVLQPAIQRVFNILYRSNKLPEVPDALKETEQKGGLEIEFNGFFAQIQKKYYATNGIQSALQYAMAFAQTFGQESLDNVDSDALLRESFSSAAAPARALRDKKTVQAIRVGRAQQQAAAAQAQMQMAGNQALLQNMDKLGKAPESGSPLEAMDQGSGNPLEAQQ